MTWMRLRRWAFVLLAATPGLSCIVHPVAAHPETIPPDEASSQRGLIPPDHGGRTGGSASRFRDALRPSGHGSIDRDRTGGFQHASDFP